MPSTASSAGSFDFHIRIDSGSSSPNTTYSMAPEAKLSDSTSAVGLMVPIRNPSTAPRMVGAPDSAVTRGQTVTFLWRAMGCPEPTSTDNPFEDVTEGKYYYNAVLWAVEKGITNGTDATHFTPNQTCSTAHIITFLYRTLGIGTNGWYKEAEEWARGAGLLDGLNVSVAPGVDCPRSDVVLFLYRQLGA